MVLCRHCNAHFASFAYLAALQHEHCGVHNPVIGSDNGWATYGTNTDTPRMTTTSVISVIDTNVPVCSCVVDPMPCVVAIS